MKIMCDTNIILDMFLDRLPFSDASSEVLHRCERGTWTGFITASSITDISYFIHKYIHDTELTYQALGKLLNIVKICDVTSTHVFTAYQQHARDFEDCLLATCAQSISCDYIVTRNKKDFIEFSIPSVTPEELLTQ